MTNAVISSVIIAGGGTGGHIYPGIAIAQEFKRRNPNCQIVFIGTARGLETKIVPREGFKLELIEVAALKGVSIAKRGRSLLMLPKSFFAVRSLIRKYKPDVVIGVGGYASGPMLLAASLMGVPTMVAEQNALPGFTNRVLARFVKAAAVSFAEAQSYFRGKAEITGNPVRAEFFSVPPKTPSNVTNILITGGSQGARAINEAMMTALPALAENKDELAIVHQTGELDFEKVKAAYATSPLQAEVKPFIEKMVEEFTKADFVISRAGATTVAELAAAGLGEYAAAFASGGTAMVTGKAAELKTATFAAGCFWCMEAIYESIEGVGDVVSGFTGGQSSNPTYHDHGNHTETVEFSYDPQRVSLETLLRVFWKSHDASDGSGVAPDFGPSYRPVLFYRTPEEKAEIERVKALVQKDFSKPIATEIGPFEKFWKTEDYHQNYAKLHPNDRYVTNVSLPRVREALESLKKR